MNEIDGIIKLLIEDTEYDIAQYIEDNKDRLEKHPLLSWNDTKGRRMIITDADVGNGASVIIRDYFNDFQKIYYNDKVYIQIRD